MLKLCGFCISNYYNKVKFALLEKSVPFEEELHATGKDAMSAGSVLGKVPFLKIPGGVLCESQAIVEYLEDAYPNPPLYPRDPVARARCRELIDFIELYLELPARRLYPEVYFGGSVSEEVKKSVREVIEKGVSALKQTAKFSPYIAGAEFSYADCAAYVHLPLVAQSTKKIYGEDFLARIPEIGPYLERLRERRHAKKINDDRKAALDQRAAAAAAAKQPA